MRNGGRKISSDKQETKSPVKPTLDMVGECILILLDCKSGNIERLLLRFCDENQKRKFCGDVLTSAQNRKEMFCLCGIQAALRGQGEPRSDQGQSVAR